MMFVCKAGTGVFRNALWKSENIVSLGIIRCSQNPYQTKQLYFVHKRYKKTSSDEKKRCEDIPKKSRKLATLAKIAVVGTTVAVIAAKYDDDFREWSKEHVPALDSLVKIVFQEEETYLQTLDRAHKALSAWIKNALYDLFKENKQSKGISPRSDDSLGLPPMEPCEESKNPYKPPESVFAVKSDSEKKGDLTPTTGSGSSDSKELRDLKDLEEKLGSVAQEAMKNLATTTCALKDRAKLLDYLDQIVSTGNRGVWNRIKKLRDEGRNSKVKSINDLKKLEELREKLLSKLEDSPSLSGDVKAKAEQNLKTVEKDIKSAVAKRDKLKEDHYNIAKRVWDKVKQARVHFSDQLETLFPNVWLNDEKLNLPVDQLDNFTESVLNDIDYLGRQLAKNLAVYEAQLNAATEKYKAKGTEAIDDIADVVVPYEISKEKNKRQAEIQKNMLAHKAKCDKNAKAQMKQTTEVYSDLTAEALKLKEKEVERRMQQRLEEQLAEARAQHKMEIAKMVGRMLGANEAIANRGEKDKKEQEKQQFWSAAQSLMAAVKPLGGGQSQERKPLKNEITNINKVKPEGDELVDSVLSSIPEEAVDRGVPSESSLRENFIKVMKCARGWAGVPPGEITLLQLLLARVQYALYLNAAIPQAELDNEPAIDPEKLNNYDILFRAKYYVDKGEFDQAIRYLNLLKGPSNQLVGDWVKDALVYLETRQAAELLLAHATAASMS